MTDLDPNLFEGTRLRHEARTELLRYLYGHLQRKYGGSDNWLHAWLAGSGVSYHWGRNNDLDVLIGIDFVQFRYWTGIKGGDADIAKWLNEELRAEVWPQTADWHGYEVTWYVNPRATDIRMLNPYAAYDLINDEWTVPPKPEGETHPPAWDTEADSWADNAETALKRYAQALTEVQNATNPAHRTDAEHRLSLIVAQIAGMYTIVHRGRSAAFSPAGAGYDDYGNYIWRRGKEDGWIQALKEVYDYQNDTSRDIETYGIELPDADTLVRRAVIGRL